MAVANEDRKTLIERYGQAAESDNLLVTTKRRTDADYLLAAGYAAAGNVRGQVALAVHRMVVTNNLQGAGPVTEHVMALLMALELPHARGRRLRLKRPQARRIAEVVLHWFVIETCPGCLGRRYLLVPGTQIVSDHVCPACMGEGKRPVDSFLTKDLHQPAAWLVAQLEDLMSYVRADMARRLSNRIDTLNLGDNP